MHVARLLHAPYTLSLAKGHIGLWLIQGEETIVPVPTFRSTLPVGGDRPMHRTVQEDNI